MKTQLLRAEIVKNGLTLGDVAKELGITPKTLGVKLKKGVMGTDEALKLVRLLHIEHPERIFFDS